MRWVLDNLLLVLSALRSGSQIVALPASWNSRPPGERAELFKAVVEVANVLIEHPSCLVERGPDGQLTVYAIPEGPGGDGGGVPGEATVLSMRDKVVAEIREMSRKVA